MKTYREKLIEILKKDCSKDYWPLIVNFWLTVKPSGNLYTDIQSILNGKEESHIYGICNVFKNDLEWIPEDFSYVCSTTQWKSEKRWEVTDTSVRWIADELREIYMEENS